jgi:acetyltransferase-like isoleucine patch superfamily enzyme
MASCLFTGNSIITSSAKIGSHTYGHDVNIQNARIGSYCSLGPSVKIGLDEHPLNEPSTHPKLYKSKPIQKISIIGDHVWIGAGAIILSGVSIGSHAVIAAGAVVTRDVDPFLIYGGIPARKIGELDRSLKLN